MNWLKKISFLLAFVILTGFIYEVKADNPTGVQSSTKKERNHITKGNKLYEEGKFLEALKQYQGALQENPSSQVAKYNAALSEIVLGSNPNDTSEAAKKILESGVRNMQQVANLGNKRPDLSSKANYNLGNVSFNSEDYKKAIDYYKNALRLNPEDNSARRNLRIAQLKIQNQEDNQDQDQDQEQNQDNQDQNQDQNQQDQNQEDNQDQNQDQQDQEQNQPQNALNQQTAEQILNAIENKENQTRARVAGQNAEKSRQRNRNRRNW